MVLSEETKKNMNSNFWDNAEPDSKMLDALKTPEELDYLVEIANWDVCVSTTLKWVAENPLCSKATALRMFWMAQPEDYTKYDFDEKIGWDQELFDLIKIIFNNYQKNFYTSSDIHYDPQNDMQKKDETPDFMKRPTDGEEWYIYYKEFELPRIQSELEAKYKNADTSMELFNLAYFCTKPKNAELILNHKLCDKGIAVMLFWRLKTFANIYTATDLLLHEIEHKVRDNAYEEIIAYDPKTDDNIKFFNKPNKKWRIPNTMKQAI